MVEKNEEIRSLKVLYVEDEDLAREKLGKFLQRKFDNVELCANGLDGFLAFEKAFHSNQKFDLVISDINMPKMDGLEMFEKIKEVDTHIPSMLITARTETEQLLKAISLHIDSYILKPIDLTVIDEKLNRLCSDIFYKKNYENQKKELQTYLDILNQEAIVSKTDLSGKITYVNDGFCVVTGYEESELIGKSHKLIRHPEVPKEFFKTLWETIQAGKIWSGTFKNLAKDGSTFFVNTKIIPIFDSSSKEISEYIAVRFLVTEDELKKRESYKKYLEQVAQYKRAISGLNKEKENLAKRVIDLTNINATLETKAHQTEAKRKQLLNQLEAYEKNNLEYDKVNLMTKQDKTKQFEQMYKALNTLKGVNKRQEKSIRDLEAMLLSKKDELDDFIKKDLENKKRINDLKDLVTNLQKENEELKTHKKTLF
ncbi:response regulator [Halarcobacter ebronensis]|uniref:response regulator n=1 Tax=Halarcobacter ebronensis TaxID=1462615 RepID=UPI003C711A9E